ncbi:hypothetical protein [Mycolicibacterium sp.]|jgi:hypothetical protein|uniref:hypothetical protein n=1 Tax=Mycolicibacterium sp. TaxID=2320850 RepID=UPI001A239126|nr:hypothetical protein [Mycolicibacterium sp.]MBJ7400500.1 hypothetical protein [Mycolicibacterium sp.]
MKKLALTMLAVAAMSMGSLVAGPTAGADVRDPFDPFGVGGFGGIGGPIAGPIGPVGVGGVLGPVGYDPIVHAGVDAAVVDTAIHYDIPYGYPLGPAFPGELPCFTPAGEAYYTPGAEPCLCFVPTGAVVPC